MCPAGGENGSPRFQHRPTRNSEQRDMKMKRSKDKGLQHNSGKHSVTTPTPKNGPSVGQHYTKIGRNSVPTEEIALLLIQHWCTSMKATSQFKRPSHGIYKGWNATHLTKHIHTGLLIPFKKKLDSMICTAYFSTLE